MTPPDPFALPLAPSCGFALLGPTNPERLRRELPLPPPASGLATAARNYALATD